VYLLWLAFHGRPGHGQGEFICSGLRFTVVLDMGRVKIFLWLAFHGRPGHGQGEGVLDGQCQVYTKNIVYHDAPFA
jgi:hypothetical protein